MPKYRKLYAKTVDSLDLNEMPDDFTRLFWVLLPLALCREGRGLDNAAWLKSRLFPLREDVSQQQVYDAFHWCCGQGMIEQYAVNGRAYFYVPTFAQYQGDTSKEAESDYPPPPVLTCSRPTPELVKTYSPSDADATTDADADADATTTATAVAAAVDVIGFDPDFAPELVAEYGPGPVLAWAAAIPHKKGIRDKPAFVRSELEKGHSPPSLKRDNGRRRFIEGEYADYVEH